MEPRIIRRRSIRLASHDYRSPGTYFVTICAAQRRPLFGCLAAGGVVLSEIGTIVEYCWREIPKHFPSSALDEWVIMPDHLHGIVTLSDPDPGMAGPATRPPSQAEKFARPALGSLPTIMRSFKSASTRRIRIELGVATFKVWQRGYHERIVRDAAALDRIRVYVVNNPAMAR